MTASRGARIALALALVAILVCGLVLVLRSTTNISRTQITAYFDDSNGIYPGDDVRILGVPVGKIETIEPQPLRAKITFWVDDNYKIPADAKAVILSPTLVSARFIQLTPAYSSGPAMQDDAIIPQARTAVPVEFDDLRDQLAKLNKTLQPTQPGGVSTAGQFVNTLADNLRGQGGSIRDTLVKLSQTLSILGDHSGDLFGTIKNLALLVSALQDSTGLLRELNQNLAGVTSLLADDPTEVGRAIADLNTAVTDARQFVADNREPLGVTFDKLSEITQALGQSIPDIKQALHVFPTQLSNYVNIYEPAHGAVTGGLAVNQFSNPVSFICGAIQAASRLGAEQSAKLCVQYLAPIFKNRQFNFPPLGQNLFVGAQARPNEITYSEDWLRPDYVPPPAGSEGTPHGALPPAGSVFTNFGEPAANPAGNPPFVPSVPPPPAGPVDQSAPVVETKPADGLTGMMVPVG